MWDERSPPRDQTLSPVSQRQAGNSMVGSTQQNSASHSPVHFAQDTTYSVPQVVFPEFQFANFVCAHCLESTMVCPCNGVAGRDYIMAGLPPMPLQPTAVERLARWAALVTAHPEGCHFDAKHFVQDMVNRNLLFTLASERSRLQGMAEDHAMKMADASEVSRLPSLFAAGRLQGSLDTKIAALQVMTVEAMAKLGECSWSCMSPLEVALCQNAFQTSNPSRYPLCDPNLQLIFDLVGVLTAVNQMSFSTRGWHLRFES